MEEPLLSWLGAQCLCVQPTPMLYLAVCLGVAVPCIDKGYQISIPDKT